jgi:hypothetical protein
MTLLERHICNVCGKPVDTEVERYGVVWDLPFISFAHVACMENIPGTDISEEMARYKREAEQRIKAFKKT